MLVKLFLIGSFITNFFILTPAFAQGTAVSMPPEFNPICWKKSACEKFTKAKNGFVPNEAPCTGGEGEDQWGKCLPAGSVKTQISFGGISNFTGLGDFILKNYNFAITLAGILAVIVIIMSGFQWTMSGGNSETIATAKHRIGNAVIGMFIAYSSFFILNTINPDLVNLRPPKTYMVKPLSEVPKFCSLLITNLKPFDVPTAEETKKRTTPMFLPVPETDQKKPVPPPPEKIEWKLSYEDLVSPTNQDCGTRYWFDGGGSATCFGNSCSGGRTCTNLHFTDRNNSDYGCEPGILFGKITANYLIPPICQIVEGYKYPFIESLDKESKIYKICKDNTLVTNANPVSNAMIAYPLDEKLNLVGFVINSFSDTSQDCGEGKNFFGYALGLKLKRSCTAIKWTDIVAIDKNGNHLGELESTNGNNYIIRKLSKQISAADFWTYDELVKGQQINIDVSTFKPQ